MLRYHTDIRRSIRHKDMYGFVGLEKEDEISNFFGDYWLMVGVPFSHPFYGVPVELMQDIFGAPLSIWEWSWKRAPNGYGYITLHSSENENRGIERIKEFMEFMWTMRLNYTREEVEETIRDKIGEKPYSGDDYRTMGYISEKFGYINASVSAHNFGVIVPGRTGVVFQQQTDGCSCHQVYQEGTFIPIRKPMSMGKWDDEKGEIVGTWYPLSEIQEEYYNHGGRPGILKLLWKWVKKTTYLDFEFIETPEGCVRSCEAFEWIRFTKIRDHMDKNLLGRDLVLVYPNCD